MYWHYLQLVIGETGRHLYMYVVIDLWGGGVGHVYTR